MIEIIDLQKTYTVNPILKGISTTINDGDIISVIGGSGCGKSTFIRCINMLEKPSGGKVLLNSEDITREGYDLTGWLDQDGVSYILYDDDNYYCLGGCLGDIKELTFTAICRG